MSVNINKNAAPYLLARKVYRTARKMYYALKVSRKSEPPISLDTHEDTFRIDFAHRGSIIDEFRYLALKYNASFSGSTISDFYFDMPLDEHAILMVGLGKNVRGNLQYLLNELNASERFSDFHIYVRTSSTTDSIVQEYIRQNGWTRTTTVCGDKPYRRLMESCKYLITEVYMPEAWVKKPGQFYINIWHGTPLKKLGLAKNTRNSHRNGPVQKNFINADYLTYPNDYTKEKMLESYKVSQLMGGKTVMLGYPRTGGLLQASRADQSALRQRLAPGGEKLYAYMPTFRDYLSDEESIAEVREFLDYVDNHLRHDQILYVNLHHRLNGAVNYDGYRHIRPFPPTIDSYKLLAETDCLISDYSSVFFDYLALRKQIILYIPDYEKYCKVRGVFMDLLELPFDKARTKEEVLDALNRGKTYDDTQAFQAFCPHDSTENAKKVCQLIFREENGLDVNEISHDGRPRILMYSDAYEEGAATSLLQQFTKSYDSGEYDLYLGCDMDAVNNNRNNAYPMMFENAVIGAEGNPHLTSLGKSIRGLYLDGKIPFAQAMGYLKYDYALVSKRMYGQAQFQCTFIYDVIDPEKIIALAEMDTVKIMFLHKHLISKISSEDTPENTFLKDAIRYAGKYCREILVTCPWDKHVSENLLGAYWVNRVRIVKTAHEMELVIWKVLESRERT